MGYKEILLVSNYFPPEGGAASNRMYAMAETLNERGYKTHVVCPLPNYPKGKVFDGFKGKIYSVSFLESLSISRLWVHPSNSRNKFVRLLSMVSFALSLAVFLIIKKTPKLVIVQYSPILVGFTAVFFSWILRKKLILNVSDLWPLAGLEMGLYRKGVTYSILERMERLCLNKSSLILAQSEEIEEHITTMGIKNKTMLYRNYPQFEPPAPLKEKTKVGISIVYAGLLGIAQGMYSICSTITIPEGITLHIYGSGPEAQSIESLHKSNIKFHGEVTREQLHLELVEYDIAFIPLIRRIYGSVPSKIFEYTRLGIPVLFYAGGEGEQIVDKHALGWSVPAGNLVMLQEFLDTLTAERLVAFPKTSVQQKSISAFNFEDQFVRFIEAIECL